MSFIDDVVHKVMEKIAISNALIANAAAARHAKNFGPAMQGAAKNIMGQGLGNFSGDAQDLAQKVFNRGASMANTYAKPNTTPQMGLKREGLFDHALNLMSRNDKNRANRAAQGIAPIVAPDSRGSGYEQMRHQFNNTLDTGAVRASNFANKALPGTAPTAAGDLTYRRF